MKGAPAPPGAVHDPTRPCRARQYSDQMNCRRCGLVWDMNDPHPPPCNPDRADWPTFVKSLLRELDDEKRNDFGT